MPSPSAADAPSSRIEWLRGLGLIWIALFFAWFFSFELANARGLNGGITRGDVWTLLPDILLESVYPTRGPDSPPSGWSYLPQRFGLFALAAFILASAWALGHLLLRLMTLRNLEDAASRTVFAFGMGLSGLSLMTLACGLAGLLHRSLFAVLLAGFLVIEFWLRRRESNHRDSGRVPWSRKQFELLPVLCILAALPFVLAMVLGSALPSIDFDVKEYHLEGPKEYFLQGRIQFLPHNVYTSFPFLTEMLSLLAIVLQNDWDLGAQVGKVVLMTFAPLTALGLVAASRRHFIPAAGWLAALLYLSTPWVYRISIIAYTEGGLAFYLFATLLAVLHLIPPADAPVADSTTSFDSPRVLLCGLLAGSAVACKYPGVLSVAIPMGGLVLLLAWQGSRRTDAEPIDPSVASRTRTGFRRVAVAAGWFTLGTLLTFGPWMAKNVAETGNPVYPLLYSLFGGADWSAAAHQKWQAGHTPAILDLARDPAKLFGDLGSRLVDVVARSDWQSPLLFAAAPLALLWPRRRSLVLGLWAYVAWLFLSWWALTHQIDRFWVPLLPVASLLAGIGLGSVLGLAEDGGTRPSRGATIGRLVMRLLASLLIGAALVFNLAYVTMPWAGYNAYLMDLDAARRQTETPSIALLNDLLPPEARVLFVGEAEVFDAEFEYVYNTVFDESIFERWTSAGRPGIAPAEQPLRSPEAIQQTLRSEGITHIFVNWSEILRYRLTYGYTEFVSPQRFHDLVRADVLTPVALPPHAALRRWEGLGTDAQAVVEAWGGSLRRQYGPYEALQQYELFEVR